MSYVLAVADAGNFSLAAQNCHVGQPALSQQIARLEKELGVTLFTRSSKGAVPTQAGREFVGRAREILRAAQALQEEMSLYAGLRKGTLTLGIITSLQCIDFGDMLSAFCSSYPDISVNILQEGTYRLVELLLERRIDLAFVNLPEGGLPAGLEFAKLGEDRYSLAVSRLHPLARAGTGKHIFTHVEWHMTAWTGELDGPDLPEGWVWASRAELRDTYAVPNAFQAFTPLVARRLGEF